MSSRTAEVERDVTFDSPSMRFALGLAAMVIALPGTIFFGWGVVTEVSAGFVGAGAVFALIALLPVLAGAISARRKRTVSRSLTAVILTGSVQLLCMAVLSLFIPTI